MATINEVLTPHISNCSKTLRVIGDALEALRAEMIDVRCEGENYIVRAKSRRQPSKISLVKDLRKSGFRVLWQILPGRYPWKRSSVALELFYTPKDVERLEYAGQMRRGNGGMPDPYSLATALRTIGAYIDSKGGRLLQISRRDELMIIRYETLRGDRCTEELTASSLYALFVRMYLKRSDRRSKMRILAMLAGLLLLVGR